ncbi:MAG: ABC transporter ATP-binding protein [Desulfobacterales bacterium]|nr:ABC transporter ATP-binding protein [Desulfobacterales bacterium]
MSDQNENKPDNPPLLSVEGVSKAFGGVQAVRNVSFSLAPGTITGLIGPNGAGKTTLFNLITSVFPANSGKIAFDGTAVHKLRINDLVRRGIARTFQNVELFESMTVLENILVGQHTRMRCGMWGSIFRFPRVRREERQARENAMALLSFVGIDAYANQKSSDLPFGWQRLLELARALAAQPKLLLLDEPAAGLNITETAQLGKLIQKIREQGITILLVEHDMSLTMSVSDKIIVLDQGEKIAEGLPREVQDNEAVIKAYLGTTKN